MTTVLNALRMAFFLSRCGFERRGQSFLLVGNQVSVVKSAIATLNYKSNCKLCIALCGRKGESFMPCTEAMGQKVRIPHEKAPPFSFVGAVKSCGFDTRSYSSSVCTFPRFSSFRFDEQEA